MKTEKSWLFKDSGQGLVQERGATTAIRMTEVITSVEPGTEDFGGGGGAGGEQDSIFPDVHERNPKLSKRLPSIVVEPTDAAEVESGELRWPPEDGSSADAQTERRSSDKHTADVEKTDIGGDEEGVEMQDSN